MALKIPSLAKNPDHKPRVFVITSRIYESAGGRTKATIERMIMLQKHFDITLIEMSSVKYPGQELPAIFTKYQAEFAVINPWTGLRPTGRAAKITKNYVQYLRSRTGGLDEQTALSGAQKAFELSTLAGGKIKTYVENGKIARLREYHPDGRVEFFALNERQNIILHELYYKDALQSRYYLDAAGNVTAGFAVDQKGDKTYVYRTQDGQLVYSDTVQKHQFAFLQDALMPGDVIISDVRHYDVVLAQLPTGIRKIHVWHEAAVDATGKEVSPDYVLSTGPDFSFSHRDAVVVFTDTARDEYARAFPQLDKHFAVIPYGIDAKSPIAGVKRDENLVISVGRLELGKDVAAQIQAFGLFRESFPEARLKIIGEGSREEELRTQVEALQLDESVEFSGFSHEVDAEMQRASMMVFSSQAESFGLVLLESLSNGTPVASYDVRFGPSFMIKNGKNGLVVEKNTPEELAKAMVELRKLKLSPKKVQRSVKKLSRENFERQWVDLVMRTGKK